MPRSGLQERRYRCDVHTHTLYSRHAYSTVEENVRAAAERHIELLGITEHFSDMLWPTRDFRNFQYFINVSCWPRMWHGVRLLHGCEADIVDLDGHLYGWDTVIDHEISGSDRPTTTLKDLVFRGCDYVVASVHDKTFANGATRAQMTQAYLNALEDPKVLIVGHAGRSGLDFDFAEVVAAAHDLHKLIEINEHSFAVGDSRTHGRCRELAELCAQTGTKVAVSTDAHISYDIGRFEKAPALLDEVDFPAELIATRSADAFLAALDAAGMHVDL